MCEASDFGSARLPARVLPDPVSGNNRSPAHVSSRSSSTPSRPFTDFLNFFALNAEHLSPARRQFPCARCKFGLQGALCLHLTSPRILWSHCHRRRAALHLRHPPAPARTALPSESSMTAPNSTSPKNEHERIQSVCETNPGSY